jgi:hypothetical protein
VLKVSQAALDQAFETGEEDDADIAGAGAEQAPEEPRPETVPASESPATPETAPATGHPTDTDGLTPEEEAELQRELAQVEAEFGTAGAPEVPEETGTPEETDEETAGRARLPDTGDERDVERIFDETDSHLEEPEGSERRSTIQHLRAAVEATRADEAVGKASTPEPDETPYRTDLAEVVRPRRPRAATGGEGRTRPESRPAPLRLVAEQRIDTEQEPVRPRRVSRAEPAEQPPANNEGPGKSFAEYVQETGADGLPQVMEAAAAYLTFVEERPQFSRAMLMKYLKEVKRDDFSREDGLRAFGELLRGGKLHKVRGGRFELSDRSEYHDAQRRVG